MPNYYVTSFANAPASAIEQDIRAAGIEDERIIAHALQINPGDFRPWEFLPPPCVPARLAAALQPEPDSRVLEIGTGTGYAAALLAVLSRHVVTMEVAPRMFRMAQRSFQQVAFGHKVIVVQGDGRQGCPRYAPYDRICVSGSVGAVSAPLLGQLAEGGRLLAPVGPADRQELQLITRRGEAFDVQRIASGVMFAPLTAAGGMR